MSNAPVFVYIARPTTKVRLKGLFDFGPLWHLLEHPGGRSAGWTLQTQDQAKIVRGEYLEVALSDILIVQLYEDGMLIAKAKADADYLAWGSLHGRPDEKPRLNPLAVVEFTYNFADLYRRVLEHSDREADACAFHVTIQNAVPSDEDRLYLNPHGVDTWARLLNRTQYRAPDNRGDIEIAARWSLVLANPARVAYLVVERIYVWFGVPTNQIPYVTGAGDDRAVDTDMVGRGGRPPS